MTSMPTLNPGEFIRLDKDVPKTHDLVICIGAKPDVYVLAMVDEDLRVVMTAQFKGLEIERIIGHLQDALKMDEPGKPSSTPAIALKP